MSTYAHRFRVRRPHLNPWFVAVIALAAALIGLSIWVIVDQTSSESAPAEPTHGLASGQVVAMLDARLAALNSGGKQSFASYYSPGTVFEDRSVTPPIVVRGAHVASLMEGFSKIWAMAGQRISRESEVIQFGNYAAHAIRLGNTDGISVYKLDQNGKIEHQWVLGSGMGSTR